MASLKPDHVSIRIPNEETDGDTGTVPAPKQPKTNKPKRKPSSKKVSPDLAQGLLSGLLQTTSTIAAKRVGDHWSMQPEEAEAIATPIAQLLDKYDLLKIVEDKSEWIMLIAAIGAYTVPRVMMQKQLTEYKKQVAPTGRIERTDEPNKSDSVSQQQKGTVSTGDTSQTGNGGDSAYAASDAKQFLSGFTEQSY